MLANLAGWHIAVILIFLLIPIAIIVAVVLLIRWLVRITQANSRVSLLAPESRAARAAALRAQPVRTPQEKHELDALTRLGA